MFDPRWVLIGMVSLAGLAIVWKRLKLYMAKRRTIAELQSKGVEFKVMDETRLPMLSCVLILVVVCVSMFRTNGNAESICLWIVIGQIAISEMINAQLMKKTYFSDEEFVFYHRVFAYTDIQRLSVSRSRLMPGESYMVETRANQIFNVPAQFFKELQVKTNLTVQP